MNCTISQRRFWTFCLLIAFIGVTISEANAADSLTVTGAIFNRAGAPLPGCTVFVISGNYRTAPSITAASGEFAIELSLQPGNPAYYLEIYWGQELMYRKPIDGTLFQTSKGVLTLPRIILGL